MTSEALDQSDVCLQIAQNLPDVDVKAFARAIRVAHTPSIDVLRWLVTEHRPHLRARRMEAIVTNPKFLSWMDVIDDVDLTTFSDNVRLIITSTSGTPRQVVQTTIVAGYPVTVRTVALRACASFGGYQYKPKTQPRNRSDLKQVVVSVIERLVDYPTMWIRLQRRIPGTFDWTPLQQCDRLDVPPLE